MYPVSEINRNLARSESVRRDTSDTFGLWPDPFIRVMNPFEHPRYPLFPNTLWLWTRAIRFCVVGLAARVFVSRKTNGPDGQVTQLLSSVHQSTNRKSEHRPTSGPHAGSHLTRTLQSSHVIRRFTSVIHSSRRRVTRAILGRSLVCIDGSRPA